jgi:hypothetical protein
MIKIGADELILWLRKNGKAENLSNDGTYGLGFRIKRLIEEFGGHLVEENRVCYWEYDKNGKQIELPKTAAQYQIDEKQLPALYNELSKL